MLKIIRSSTDLTLNKFMTDGNEVVRGVNSSRADETAKNSS